MGVERPKKENQVCLLIGTHGLETSMIYHHIFSSLEDKVEYYKNSDSRITETEYYCASVEDAQEIRMLVNDILKYSWTPNQTLGDQEFAKEKIEECEKRIKKLERRCT